MTDQEYIESLCSEIKHYKEEIEKLKISESAFKIVADDRLKTIHRLKSLVADDEDSIKREALE